MTPSLDDFYEPTYDGFESILRAANEAAEVYDDDDAS